MTLIFSPLFSGFALGGSLIIAIGAQNAFILRKGLLRQHVFILCLISALSDALLIFVGISGMGAFVDENPFLLKFVAIGGGAFLLIYAFNAAHRAMKTEVMKQSADGKETLLKAILICLALTFLNPHVYLDTVVLIGTLGATWKSELRPAFAIGAITASFVWFFALGFGARFLIPLFEKPVAWRILDAIIAIVMGWLGISLIWGAFY